MNIPTTSSHYLYNHTSFARSRPVAICTVTSKRLPAGLVESWVFAMMFTKHVGETFTEDSIEEQSAKPFHHGLKRSLSMSVCRRDDAMAAESCASKVRHHACLLDSCTLAAPRFRPSPRLATQTPHHPPERVSLVFIPSLILATPVRDYISIDTSPAQPA